MAKQVFKNGASATLAVSVIAGDLTIQVQAGYGALFPSPTGGDWFIAALEDSNGNYEMVKCTARSTDLLTVVRGQEGTSAAAWTNTVTRVELRNTKGSMERMVQRTGDTLGGNLDLGGFTIDNGALGSAITGVPELAFHVGMIMLWSGAIASVPAKWALCNGAGGTPDLRDRFIVGAGNTYAVDATGGALTDAITTSSDGGHTPTGTAASHTLSTAEIPAHQHRLWGTTSGGQGDTEPLGHSLAAVAGNADGSKGYIVENGSGVDLVEATGGGGGHTHTLTVDAVPGHTHTATVDTVPPYYALAYIMYTG